MSLQALGIVASWKELPLQLRGLAYEIANCHNSETGQCNPSIGYLARRSGLTERSLHRVLADLKESGVVKIINQYVDGRQVANSYEFTYPDINVTLGGDINDRDGGDINVIQKQEEETVIKKQEKNELFEEFWSLYPRRDNKKKCIASFNNLTKKKQQLAIADIKSGRYEDREKQYIPLPTTYINGERWEDDTFTPVMSDGQLAMRMGI